MESPNLRRGEVAVTLGGEVRTLKFGMLALSKFLDLYEVGPADIQTVFDKNPIKGLFDLVYCALQVRAKANNLPADFSRELAHEWADELSDEDYLQVQQGMHHALSVGNAPAA